MSRPPGEGSRRLSRPAKLTLAFLGAAGMVGLWATLQVVLGIDPSLWVIRPPVAVAGVLVAACTVGNLLLRFVRWQYLLRRVGVRLPTLPSLGAFVGSFAFLPVPLYLGQLVARVRLGAAPGTGERGSLVVAFLWERALDVWVLALVALPAMRGPGAVAVLALLVLVALGPVRRGFLRAARGVADVALNEPAAVDDARVERMTGGAVFAASVLLTVAAWGLTALSLVPLAWAAGVAMDPVAGVSTAARTILVGGLGPLPLGVGVAGLALLGRLHGFGADAAQAAQVAFVFRAASVWFTVGLGAVALLVLRRRARTPAPHDHFDHIDACYDAWLPLRYRTHLVEKKTAPMLARLGPLPAAARGLDIGCGRGWYLREMRRSGAHMVGIDTSWRQLAAAREYLGEVAPLAQGSVLGVPFRRGTFDFAYIINVLHHMPTPEHQRRALREIAAVVRPGGRVFVHEMNVVNPLFRFYLGYVFPILKGIEEGTEPYMDARRLPKVEGLTLEAVEFFTFIPDFVPSWLLPALAGLERRLERGRAARYGAHFLAVYVRSGGDELAPALGSR